MIGDTAVNMGRDGPSIGRSEWPLWLGLMALLCLGFQRMGLMPNEGVYLLGPLRVTDPSLLAHDWSHAGPPLQSIAVLFRVLVAPFFLLSEDPLVVALIVRPLLWLWVLAGFRVVARSMGLTARAWAAGMALYILSTPGLSAGEWIFGGAEQKVLSYGAVLFAVAAMGRGRVTAAGAWIGLATAAHLLVGGWAGAALGVASLTDVSRLGFKRLVLAGALAAIVASPILLIGFDYLASDGETVRQPISTPITSDAEFLVKVRVPHHLDPVNFLNPRTIPEIPLIFGFTLWLLARTVPAARRRLFVTFMAALGVFYLIGLVARPLGLYSLLKFYPFRVGDALTPALFWLCVPNAAADWRRMRSETGAVANRALSAALVVAMLFFAVEFRDYLKQFNRTVPSWLPAARAEHARELAIYEAIRNGLPSNAVIASAACEDRIWIHGQRATVAAYKSAPSNDRIFEWRDRIEALQGGEPVLPFSHARCVEADEIFMTLPIAGYVHLRDRYGATHALIDAVRDDLTSYEVLRVGGRTVVDLRAMPAGANKADPVGNPTGSATRSR